MTSFNGEKSIISIEHKIILLTLIILILLPLYIPIYYIRLLTTGLLYGLAAVGFNILYGYTGLLSFGHSMFWAVGAYGLAIGLVKIGLDPFSSILLSVGLTLLVSIVTGYLSLKHTKIYFAMLTLAFSQLIYAIILKFRDITGGDEGIYNIPRFPHDIFSYYYAVLLIVSILVFLAWWIMRTPIGLIFQSIRDNPYRSEVIGLPVRKIRLISYIISGLYVGIGGLLYAPLHRAITPDIAYWTFSALIVIMAILGGSRSIIGPFLGGLLFIFIINQVMTLTFIWQFSLGLVLVILVYLAPEGIIGVIDNIWRWKRR